MESNAAGEFKPDIYKALAGNPDLIAEIANILVTQFIDGTARIPVLVEAAPHIHLMSRQYWWVSQNQTYQHEVPGNFMWSPKTNVNGGPVPSYEFMKEMCVGDIVFSYANTYIKAIGVVTAPAQSSVKPDFGNAGANWLNDGWLVDVAFQELGAAQFQPREHMVLLTPTLPDLLSPIRPDGGGNQIYLAKISEEMADVLIALSNGVGDSIVNELSQNLDFVPPKDENAEVDEINMRTDIGPTQKTQMINSRRGQGVFKAQVRQIERACRITQVTNPRHLIASHIKPWRKSNDAEKISGYNGLLLAPHIDHLFDKGFISFESNGNLILSSQLDNSILKKWSIDKGVNVGRFKNEQQQFLEYHRDVILK